MGEVGPQRPQATQSIAAAALAFGGQLAYEHLSGLVRQQLTNWEDAREQEYNQYLESLAGGRGTKRQYKQPGNQPVAQSRPEPTAAPQDQITPKREPVQRPAPDHSNKRLRGKSGASKRKTRKGYSQVRKTKHKKKKSRI